MIDDKDSIRVTSLWIPAIMGAFKIRVKGHYMKESHYRGATRDASCHYTWKKKKKEKKKNKNKKKKKKKKTLTFK